MEEDKLKENVIQMIRSNHFVQEYLEQGGIAEEIKKNPRFQSIIWHISVMLKRQGIGFTEQKAVKWIQDNIKIGEQGKETLQILSKYNEDGIEESQLVDDKQSDCIAIVQRVKNRPEWNSLTDYDKKRKQIININYEKRNFWVALEDLNPNLIEVDPIGTNPLLKYGRGQFYEFFSSTETEKMRLMGSQILPLSEINREEQLQYYKELNEKYHRTKVFEKGIAKMLMVRNKDIKR